MKAKLLRRIFCVALCAVMTVSFSMSVSAAEWLTKNAVYAPDITWTSVLNYSFHTSVISNIAAGQNYWKSSDITNKPSFTQRTDAANVMCTTGSITHTSTSEESWTNYFPILSGMDLTTYALSRIVLTNGNVLEDFSSSYNIDYAIIEYSPIESRFSGLTVTDYRCLVAHEVGHCMGLNHVTDGNVMKARNLGASAINEQDAAAYNCIY